jgi:hypothetical protein
MFKMKYLINRMECNKLSQQVEWLDGKGVCPQMSRDQTSWVMLCVVNNEMLTKYSIFEFLEYVHRLIMWFTYLPRLGFKLNLGSNTC